MEAAKFGLGPQEILMVEVIACVLFFQRMRDFFGNPPKGPFSLGIGHGPGA
jgi:hypothetical protein